MALRLERGHDLLAQDRLVEQVLDADAEPRGLVGVAGADAAPRGADPELAQLRLARAVEQHVVGHDQVRVGRDLQAADVDAAALQPLDLVEQHLRVDHDAVADRAGLAGIEDPGRDQVELELLAVADDRVAGVVAALEADTRSALLGEQVGDLALALVAPLGADDDYAWHDAKVRAAAGSARGAARPGRRRSRLVLAEQRQRVAAHLDEPRDRALADLLLELLERRGWS